MSSLILSTLGSPLKSDLAIIHIFTLDEIQYITLQVNSIVCACASRNHRWLATGDAGPDSAVMIWDARSRTAVRCLYRAHPEGVVALRLTADARYLATLSAPLRVSLRLSHRSQISFYYTISSTVEWITLPSSSYLGLDVEILRNGGWRSY